MILSMTGYGKAEAQLPGGKFTVEVRSLNSKSADINIKTSLIPREHEFEVRNYLKENLIRGTIDLYVSFSPEPGMSQGRSIDIPLALSYLEAMKEITIQGGLVANSTREVAGDLLESVMRMPDVVSAKSDDLVDEDSWPLLFDAIREAVDSLVEFRAREGESLKADLENRVSLILDGVDELEVFEKTRVDSVRERILTRFEELSLEMDSTRLEAEMIYYIEKLDINEEKVRLRQHCRYFLETMDGEDCCGKKLGFIAQEMGREINTTGSKASNTDIQKIVVRMKDELEKIKEQSANVL